MKCAKPPPIEFAITRWRENRRSAFIGHRVEIDGIEQDVPPTSRAEARRWCRRRAKAEGWIDCAISEAFVGGRQSFQRGRGWGRWRSPEWIDPRNCETAAGTNRDRLVHVRGGIPAS